MGFLSISPENTGSKFHRRDVCEKQAGKQVKKGSGTQGRTAPCPESVVKPNLHKSFSALSTPKP